MLQYGIKSTVFAAGRHDEISCRRLPLLLRPPSPTTCATVVGNHEANRQCKDWIKSSGHGYQLPA